MTMFFAIDPLTILWAALVLAGLGILFGLGLAIADKFLYVKEDNRVSEITAMLPNANCGACGYPGCNGYANAIINGEAASCSLCKPGMKAGVGEKIRAYLDEHPNADGSINPTKLK